MIDEELLYQAVREKVIAVRKGNSDSKLSQEQLGKILGLSRSAVANLETGKQRFSLYNIYTLCAYLKLELSDLLPSASEVMKTDQTKLFTTGKEKITPSIEKAIFKMRKPE